MSRFTDPSLYTEERREERMRLARKRAEGIALHTLGRDSMDSLTPEERDLAGLITADVISGMNFCRTADGGLIDFEQMDLEQGIVIRYDE
ncbi:MAG: hypothetical protein J6K32_08650 [Clostridia bacterium]|nr:hypothetical protein [Clostridia bacterium]